MKTHTSCQRRGFCCMVEIPINHEDMTMEIEFDFPVKINPIEPELIVRPCLLSAYAFEGGRTLEGVDDFDGTGMLSIPLPGEDAGE